MSRDGGSASLIKPRKLSPGDTLATVSLSWGGAAAHPHRYLAGKQQLQERFGVRVVESKHALKDNAWLSRNPQARAEDWMEALVNPQINGIISNIGGNDSLRLLPYLDLGVVRANPKVFMGYSDTSISHLACLKAGVVSFYGPAILAGFAENGGIFPYTEASVRRALFSSERIGVVAPNTEGWTVEFLDWGDPALQARPRALQPSSGWRWLQGSGVATGHLIGGCLEVLDWVRGTSVWPEPTVWRGAIAFFETSEEAPPPSRVSQIFRSLAALGVLHQLRGILLGRPGGALTADQHLEYDQALLRVVSEECGLTELPVVTGMDFGHTDPMMVLPYGVRAALDCEQRTFSILESAVVD